MSTLHYKPLKAVDLIVKKLLVEEVCLKVHFKKGIMSISTQTIFATTHIKNKTHGRIRYDEYSFCNKEVTKKLNA